MTSSTIYSRGDVVYVPLPFANGQSVKPRPAIVIQADGFRSEYGHIALVPLTSKMWRATGYRTRISVQMGSADYVAMKLTSSSVIQADRIFSIEERFVIGRWGQCTQPMLAQLSVVLHLVLELP